MLKAIVSYSKKIPVPDSQYSSQGYSLSLETEIPEHEPRAIQARLHETFELVKASVEEELANGGGKQTNAKRDKPAETRSNGSGKATNQQVKFLMDLARVNRIQLDDLNAQIRDMYGVSGVYDLSRRDASRLIDDLKRAQQRAA